MLRWLCIVTGRLLRSVIGQPMQLSEGRTPHGSIRGRPLCSGAYCYRNLRPTAQGDAKGDDGARTA